MRQGSGVSKLVVGGTLGNMKDIRAIAVDGVGIIHLYEALTHVHGVSGAAAAGKDDCGVGSCSICRASV